MGQENYQGESQPENSPAGWCGIRTDPGIIVESDDHSEKRNVNTIKFENLSVFCTNVDTLTSDKLHELKLRIDNCEVKPDIISLQEVKPKNFRFERYASEYNLDGYEMDTVNLKKDTPGRGLIVYIINSLKFTQLNLNVEFCEYICIDLPLNQKDKLLFTSIYRSPNSSSENNVKLNELLKVVAAKDYSHFLTVGDFNYNGINWENYTTTGGTDDTKFNFIETIKDCFWFQHVNEATRGRGMDKPSLIDLVLTNEENMVSEIDIQAPLGKSDHSVIAFEFCTYMDDKREKVRYRFDKGDYEMMKEILDIDWKKLLVDKGIEMQWHTFKTKIISAVDVCVPKVIIKNNKRNKRKIFHVDNQLKSAIKRKERLWHKYKKSGNNTVREEYNRCRSKVRYLSRKGKSKKVLVLCEVNDKNYNIYTSLIRR